MIAIGKIGQKLIFNRQSPEGTRSNTNGNVGAFTLFNLLIKNNEKETFCVVGDSDKYFNDYENLIDYDGSQICEFGIFFIGINDDEKLINYINSTKLRYILICDDERCLDALNANTRLTHLPEHIISQSTREYTFHGKSYMLEYVPIERSVVFNEQIQRSRKTRNMTVIANCSEIYDRLDIARQLTSRTEYITIYGRLDKNKTYPKRFVGEVKYQEAQKILKESWSTLIIPVKKKVITSKYVEALLNNCLPIFYKDYYYELLDDVMRYKSLLVVENSNDVLRVYRWI